MAGHIIDLQDGFNALFPQEWLLSVEESDFPNVFQTQNREADQLGIS